jgi:hypothetical protein
MDRRSHSEPEGPAEWVGGRVVSPFYITEGTPYRPELILWLELPEGVVMHFELGDRRKTPASFGATLLKAMESPMSGPKRRPATVRVADAQLAAEVRRVLPDVRIIEAPTPELDDVIDLMSEATLKDEDREDPSYFENGRIGIEAIEGLFRAAKVLYHVAPWKVAGDSQVLRVDIPAYGVERACLSIIGALGESIGLILFPSIEGFERFLENADAPHPPGAPIDLGTTTLSLNFETGSDLPPSMRREVLKHGWPVADANAYPIVQHRDPDGFPRPLSEHDVRTLAACATSLTAFFVKHGHLFEQDVFDPVCESYFDNDDLEVRFTVPYDPGEMFAVNAPHHPQRIAAPSAAPSGEPTSKAAKVGRNRPCPCGSGKKYKLCCLPREQTEAWGGQHRDPNPQSDGVEPAAIHNLDRKVVARMERYARGRFGPDWMLPTARSFRDRTMPEALMGPWAFHHHPFEGKSIAQWILEDRGVQLPGSERAWLNAQRSAWLSVWEVLDVEPGRSVTLSDLFTGETRLVREASASRSLVKRDAILARVVDYGETSVLCGVFPRPLAPQDAAVVIARVRGRLRRKSNIPVDRMRGEAVGRYLIARWEEALEETDLRASRPLMLHNTDGDPLLLTVDHFVFDPADRDEIQRRLAAAEEVEDPPEADDPEQIYVFTKPGNEMHRGWESTVIGRVAIARDTIRVESNSIKRADVMRRLLESSLGTMIAHRGREHADPAVAMEEDSRATEASPEAPPSEEMDRILLEMKAKHYADWIDHPIPALGGKTPRATARTKAGRQMVDLLLKENENLEARAPAGQRFDFSRIRRELGLKE